MRLALLGCGPVGRLEANLLVADGGADVFSRPLDFSAVSFVSAATNHNFNFHLRRGYVWTDPSFQETYIPGHLSDRPAVDHKGACRFGTVWSLKSCQSSPQRSCDFRVRKHPSGSYHLRSATSNSCLLRFSLQYAHSPASSECSLQNDFILPICPILDGVKRHQSPTPLFGDAKVPRSSG